MINYRPIPCAHEAKGSPVSETHPDYHPLTFAELLELLKIAQHGDAKTTNAVQCRLGQAIPGTVCPHTIVGAVAEKHSWLDSIFVEAYRRRHLQKPWMARMIFELMKDA